jgi:hypothetical protein
MYEKLLLFDSELDKLIKIGWKYKILYRDDRRRIYIVRVDVPKKIWQQLHN